MDSRLTSRVELFLSLADLPNLDVLSKTDGFVVCKVQPLGRPDWIEVGRTEVVKDNTAPVFTKPILIDYRFEEVQPLKFEAWDYDGPTSADYIGEVICPLGRIMGARGSTQTLALQRPGHSHIKAGTITIRGDEVKGGSDLARLQFRCAGLDRKDWFGSSDPFLSIWRVQPDASRVKVWESTVIKNNLNPVWPAVDIPVQTICNGNMDAPLVVTCTDWDSDGSHDFIGETPATLRELLNAPASSKGFPLVNPAKATKRSYTNSGTLIVGSSAMVRVPTFLEYIQGGCAVSLMVAIDFTGSNGDPRDPGSLHSFNPSTPNEYLQAITSCCGIALEYDSDKKVPVYGFGGSVGGATNHCFPLTFNDAAPEVAGLDGIVRAYQGAFSYVALSGPTYLAPVIRRAAEFASTGVSQAKQAYTILLLITDGQSNDIDETVSAIIEASVLPLSIVIVGVGGADFSAMEFLDADKGKLSAGGRIAARDIVQFVPFRKFAAAGVGAGSLLAKEVLAEVPSQVVSAFTSRGILPNPPLAAPAPPRGVAVPVPLAPGMTVPVPLGPGVSGAVHYPGPAAGGAGLAVASIRTVAC